MKGINVFWFRRDLRLEDNAGLVQALSQGMPVLPIFIFDTNILSKLEDKSDARVSFIYQCIETLKAQLKEFGSDLKVLSGDPLELWKDLISKNDVTNVYYNHDYESYAIQRDKTVTDFLKAKGINFYTFKDHVLFEKDDVLKDDGTPYTIFTPFKNKWLSVWNQSYPGNENSSRFPEYNCKDKIQNYIRIDTPFELPSLSSMGFVKSNLTFDPVAVDERIISTYDKTRNFPGIQGTTKLGMHLRFGTISIRQLANRASELNETYLNELIWRDFYFMILHHFPHVEKQSFRPAYDEIQWRNNESEFDAWCKGQTGYPFVDAGMRELLHTGFMHNRLRMVTASFLTKHLLIDWRWGEAWFASKLLDFELASNNGGWQWAAGCGTDAAPYFRIFNPMTQAEKFDKNMAYTKKWVPEFNDASYPKPIVDHAFARERCLANYKEALNRKA